MYSATINGEPTEFGTSGLLYRSNKLMYDRATETLWRQFRGDPVVGPLTGRNLQLEILPSVLTTWSAWRTQHPDTTVISNETGQYPPESYRPESDRRSIYYAYRAATGTMFPVPGINEALPIKAPVFGLAFANAARAYPQDALPPAAALNDTVGNQPVVIITDPNGAPRAYHRGALEFHSTNWPHLQDNRGQQWQITEDALINTANPSRQLPRLPSRNAYWFGWQAFYPHTDVYAP